MTFRIQAGSIYKLPFLFTDLSGKKARPALALNDPDRNGDVRFLFITVGNFATRMDEETGECCYFSRETVKHLQRIIWTYHKPVRMIETPVYGFAA